MRASMRGLTLMALACAVVASACSDRGKTIKPSKLAKLVLQPADLPPAFSRFDEGRVAAADMPTGRRADPARFGREGGWKARYKRSGTPKTTGPLVIDSRVDLFEKESGAKDDFAAIADDRASVLGGGSDLEAPRVGDESLARTAVQAGAFKVRFYAVAWRTNNTTSSLTVSGFDGKLTFDQVLALVRKQQRRIARAVPR